MKVIASVPPTKTSDLIVMLMITLMLMWQNNVLYAQISHSVDFPASNLVFAAVTAEDGVVYEKVTISRLNETAEIGKPNLPVKYVHLILPSDQNVDRISIISTSKLELPGVHLIYPTQPPLPMTPQFQESALVEPDPTVYGSDTPYPREIVSLTHDDYFDGNNHIATVAVYPLQYYPESGKLIFFSHVSFTLELKSVTRQRRSTGRRSLRSQKIYDQILERIVDNPDDVPLYQVRSALGKISASQAVPFKSYEYVVITSSALKSQFEAFVSWKARKGYKAGTITTDEIFSHYTTDVVSCITDQAGAVRQYLSDCYYDGDPKTMWVLLAGDASTIPVRFGCGYYFTDSWDYTYWDDDAHQWITETDAYKIPADLYFGKNLAV